MAAVTFGAIVKEYRGRLGLTQAELGRRVGCAPITIRKIESNALRPSVQVAELLAVSLNIPTQQQAGFIRLARALDAPPAIPTPQLVHEEVGRADLSGRSIRSFELGARIGVGGFGVVYTAIQQPVGREVAIKIIHPHLSDRTDFVRRFEAEAQTIAQLEHPFIVPLYDYWREPGGAYLVMRMMRGGSLQARLQHGPLGPQLVLHMMEQICSALHTAHRAGVIHRDIKPANMLLDEDDNVYLADFGIAKQLGAGGQETAEGALIGSPAYISPEQIRAEPVTPQSDIYSLGVMLYELLTGRQPFRAPTPVASIQKHLSERVPPLAAASNEEILTNLLTYQPHGAAVLAPTSATLAQLDAVIARATAKHREERYPDTQSMLADLQRALRGLQAPGWGGAPDASAYVTVAIDLPDLDNPYKGLRAFTEADSANFFGRAMLIQDLLARMDERSDIARFLAVIGPSGSGKSSVVRAGLVPALRRGGLPGSEHWFITDMLPGPAPFEELAEALLRVAVHPHSDLIPLLRSSERGLLHAIQALLPDDPAIELVLILDQFEELFTLVDDEDTRTSFLNLLATAVLDPESRLRVVVTLRADFLDRPLQYADLGDFFRQRAELVVPLTPDELELAIIQPTERAGLSLERGVPELIMREIGGQHGMLPLLQYALSELFERREGRTLTRQAYREMGGALGALARRADDLFNSFDVSAQAAVRQLFFRLVIPGDGADDTRRRVLRAELETLAQIGPINSIIDIFGRYRLLTFDNDPITRSPTVEVAHEAILHSWGRLRTWLDDARADIRTQRQLSVTALEWEAAGRDSSFLLLGARLDQFAGWAASQRILLTRLEQELLDASLDARQAEHDAEDARRARELATAQQLAMAESRRAQESARSARRLRWLAGGLALLLAAAVGLSWVAFDQRSSAQRSFERAERIRLAAQAQIALDNGESGDVPALLALRSLRYGYSPEADAALLSALGRGFTYQRYLGHTDGLMWAQLSPDGLTVLTASSDHTARLWDAQTGRELRRLVGHTARINTGAFSSDGRRILTIGLDNTARLWDANTGQELRQFSGHTGGGYGIVFLPDAKTIVTTDGTKARLWNIDTGQVLREFVGHTGAILLCDVSRDGTFLATFSEDHTTRLWDIATGKEIRQFTGHSDWVSGGQISADNRYLLTSGGDMTARLWDITTGAELRRFTGHTGAVFDTRFSPDGRSVITISADKTARIWDVSTGALIRQIQGHTDALLGVDTSRDGRFALTGSSDRTAQLWDLRAPREPQALITFTSGHQSFLSATALSPDQRTLLTARTDGIVLAWDASTGAPATQISLSAAANNTLAISRDGQVLLAGDNVGTVRVVSWPSGALLHELLGHSGPTWSVAFAPDERSIVTAGDDMTVRIWDLASGGELLQLRGHTAPVRTAIFSPDGATILSGGEDGTIRLWDAHTGQELRQYQGHTGAVQALAFSGDGKRILSGGSDLVARLWDVGRPDHSLIELVGHTGPITQVAFDRDGRSALTGSADQAVRVWDLTTGNAMRVLGGHSTAVQVAAFASDGASILTGDANGTYRWQRALNDVIRFTCASLRRDLSAEERERYQISDTATTCAGEGAQSSALAPTWTAIPADYQPQPVAISIPMEFVNDRANIAMTMPIQDVFVARGDGTVGRIDVLTEQTLDLPLYSAGVMVPQDFESPLDLGPYPTGQPLNITLREWLSARGQGTYTMRGSRATIEMAFEGLVPNGLYTIWCAAWDMEHPNSMTERPCGAADGSENVFRVGSDGRAQVRIEIDALPPSTTNAVQEIAIAYHSDNQTHGPSVGEHGRNAHAHMWFDFMPPSDP